MIFCLQCRLHWSKKVRASGDLNYFLLLNRKAFCFGMEQMRITEQSSLSIWKNLEYFSMNQYVA